MGNEIYDGPERRQFLRLDYVTPIDYKVCREETISKLLQGYSSNVSEAGLLFNIKDKVNKGDILWLFFDRDTLNICEDLEKKSLIYQKGIIGKVVRVDEKPDGTYSIGIHFITREERNLTHIYSKLHFMEEQQNKINDEKD